MLGLENTPFIKWKAFLDIHIKEEWIRFKKISLSNLNEEHLKEVHGISIDEVNGIIKIEYFDEPLEYYFETFVTKKKSELFVSTDEFVKHLPKASEKTFIKANSKPITLNTLKQECIVPVFAKDNEVTISHDQFIETGVKATADALGLGIESPQVRVSHQIKGRTPDAIYLAANELRESQKTLYYERMAWVARIPEVKTIIGENEISLSIGGVRAYNHENLHSKKGAEKFKFFIGFQNMVCLNLCISTDGFRADLRTDNIKDLKQKISALVGQFDVKDSIQYFKKFEMRSLTEKQFATLIGKLRLYNHLPLNERKDLPEILLTDNQFNVMAKDYYSSRSFCRDENGGINLWRLFNLLTNANKSSYIDSLIERNVNGFELVKGLSKSLHSNNGYEWFIS